MQVLTIAQAHIIIGFELLDIVERKYSVLGIFLAHQEYRRPHLVENHVRGNLGQDVSDKE